jgi:predicted SAM-dependent methyltransferase
MRLNLGCGVNRKPGYVNVDREAAASPDLVVDLERFPWPWPTDSIDEVAMEHVL